MDMTFTLLTDILFKLYPLLICAFFHVSTYNKNKTKKQLCWYIVSYWLFPGEILPTAGEAK